MNEDDVLDAVASAVLTVLARNILKAVEKREASWDGKKYTLSIDQAAWEVAGEKEGHTRVSQLISLLLSACWNDAQDWATQTINTNS